MARTGRPGEAGRAAWVEPNATDWITAISTAGAFVAAVVAAALSARVYVQDGKRRRSEQANRIAAEEFHRRLDGVVLKYGCAV